MILYIWACVLVTAIVLYIRNKYSRFSRHGVGHFKPTPPIGNLGVVLKKKCHPALDFNKLYQAYPEDRFVGRYEMLAPVIFVRDIELVKKVTVKEFENFLDHTPFIDETVDPLFGRSLFSLRGQEWKDMRSSLSPAFTSSKMKGMVPFMVEVNEQMVKYIKKHIQGSGKGYADLDAKDLTSRYTNDVIASCAFGLKVDSHTERNNEFYTMGKATATFGLRALLVVLGYSIIPSIMKMLKFKMFVDKIDNFFRNLVLSTMQERETRHIIRPDMIHLLMEAKKGKLTFDEKATVEADTGFATVEESEVFKKHSYRAWTDDDLLAQAVLFFIAGFETVSTAMSFLMYELAVHPDVQEKLFQEIKENDVKNGGKFDYGTIQNLRYMDMVVSEVLRLWPPAINMDRTCIKDYNLGRASKNSPKDYIIKVGERLLVPTYSIHRDEKYFPNPDKFDPERFSEENKHNIQPFTYMPFGSGPRNCIGSRFALCEVKVMAYQLLLNFVIEPCLETPIPAELGTESSILLSLKGGHMLRYKPRK